MCLVEREDTAKLPDAFDERAGWPSVFYLRGNHLRRWLAPGLSCSIACGRSSSFWPFSPSNRFYLLANFFDTSSQRPGFPLLTLLYGLPLWSRHAWYLPCMPATRHNFLAVCTSNTDAPHVPPGHGPRSTEQQSEAPRNVGDHAIVFNSMLLLSSLCLKWME